MLHGEVGVRLSLCEPAAATVFAFLSNLSNKGAVDLITGIKGMAEDLMKANDSYEGGRFSVKHPSGDCGLVSADDLPADLNQLTRRKMGATLIGSA